MHKSKNLLIPLRRDKKRDFASGTGSECLGSKVRQILLTQGATTKSTGELPWRTAFGAGLEELRHQANSVVVAELARVRIRDALRQWMPEVDLVRVEVRRVLERLELKVVVRDKGYTCGGLSIVSCVTVE